MNKLKVWAALAIIAAACCGCGMSEGQTVNLYVSQLTVYERRVEADSYDLDKAVAEAVKNGTLSEADKKNLNARLNAQCKSFQDTLKNIGEASCPRPCEPLRAQYEQAFQNRIEHCQLLSKYLQSDLKGSASAEEAARVQKRSKELAIQAASCEQRIHEEKVVLARQFKELNVPETESSK